jgi:hypothetical protein
MTGPREDTPMRVTRGARRPVALPAGMRPIQVPRGQAALLLGMSEDSLDRIPLDELPRFKGGPGERITFFRVEDLDAYSRACKARAMRSA